MHDLACMSKAFSADILLAILDTQQISIYYMYPPCIISNINLTMASSGPQAWGGKGLCLRLMWLFPLFSSLSKAEVQAASAYAKENVENGLSVTWYNNTAFVDSGAGSVVRKIGKECGFRFEAEVKLLSVLRDVFFRYYYFHVVVYIYVFRPRLRSR